MMQKMLCGLMVFCSGYQAFAMNPRAQEQWNIVRQNLRETGKSIEDFKQYARCFSGGEEFVSFYKLMEAMQKNVVLQAPRNISAQESGRNAEAQRLIQVCDSLKLSPGCREPNKRRLETVIEAAKGYVVQEKAEFFDRISLWEGVASAWLKSNLHVQGFNNYESDSISGGYDFSISMKGEKPDGSNDSIADRIESRYADAERLVAVCRELVRVSGISDNDKRCLEQVIQAASNYIAREKGEEECGLGFCETFASNWLKGALKNKKFDCSTQQCGMNDYEWLIYLGSRT